MSNNEQSYYIVELQKHNYIGRTHLFKGSKNPEEVLKNIKLFKLRMDSSNKSCVLAVIPAERASFPKTSSNQLEHLAHTLSIVRTEEVYYVGLPLDKNNEYTQDKSKVTGVRIGRYIHSDFKVGDFIIHEGTGELYAHNKTPIFIARNERGNTAAHRRNEEQKTPDRTSK